MASLDILTDEAIIDYTRKGNKNFVIVNHGTIDGKRKGTRIAPISGGLYDPEIFGSAYLDRCYCGKVRTVSSEPCPECGAAVLTEEEALRRFARIELAFYYLSSLRFEVFRDFINDVISSNGITVVPKFIYDSILLGTSSNTRRMSQKVYDMCQFNYNPDTKELIVTDEITDESKCSYEGLLDIMTKYFPGKLVQYKSFINKFYIVMPSFMRPPAIVRINSRSKDKHIPEMTIWYKNVVEFCSIRDTNSSSNNYNRVMKLLSTPGERVKYTALLRAFLNYGKKIATQLLNTSKENLARTLYSIRVKNSLRSPIIPSTTLPIDEVQIPRHLAYEICREGFIKYLIENYEFTEEQAIASTKMESDNEELQKAFDEYVNGNPEKGIKQQCVIINRPPSLHELNLAPISSNTYRKSA